MIWNTIETTIALVKFRTGKFKFTYDPRRRPESKINNEEI